jgi:hypothetical protein
MARGFYQNTIALAQPDGTLKSLAGVNIFVYQPGTQTLATIYAGRTGAAQANNPLLTDSTGLVEFYADVGEYDIRTKDTNAVPRIADRTVGWNSFNGSNQGVPSALLARDNGLDLSAIAADVTRQMLPVGAVIDWWRPDGTVPIPAGFEICDGHTVSAGSHDFPNWSAQPITLPDLRNKFVIGADSLKADGTASNNGDGTAAFNAAHPNAPGIRGVGGSNTIKSLAHTHQFAHSHTTPAVTTNPASIDRSLAHAHSGGSLFVNGHNRTAVVQWGGSNEAHALANSVSGMGGGASGGEGAPDHLHYNVTPAVTTNSISTTTTDNGTMSATTDMRPQHVGLLKLMKVRRA